MVNTTLKYDYLAADPVVIGSNPDTHCRMCGVQLVRITILSCYSSNIIRDYFSGDDEDYSDVSSQAPTKQGGCLLPLRGGGK